MVDPRWRLFKRRDTTSPFYDAYVNQCILGVQNTLPVSWSWLKSPNNQSALVIRFVMVPNRQHIVLTSLFSKKKVKSKIFSKMLQFCQEKTSKDAKDAKTLKTTSPESNLHFVGLPKS